MENREWMYAGRVSQFEFTDEWKEKAEQFVNNAFGIPSRPMKVWCPCSNCGNRKRLRKAEVSTHLLKFGFTPNYHVWDFHGEQAPKRARTE
jgi:hypothetical protein